MSISSSKKFLTNIAIFNSFLGYSIYQDKRLHQLSELWANKDLLYSYTYGFYCDESMIKPNVFFPIYHTTHLAYKKNAIILKDHNDIWLMELFSKNDFFIVNDQSDTFDYSNYPIKKVNHIIEIWEK